MYYLQSKTVQWDTYRQHLLRLCLWESQRHQKEVASGYAPQNQNQVAFSHQGNYYNPLFLLHKTMAPVLSLGVWIDSPQGTDKSTNPVLQN